MTFQMNNSQYPESNLTWQILNHANKHNYAIGAYNCYNDDGVIAVIRAAERKHSAAIIQLFPWSMHFQGPEFVRYVVRAAHVASVPVAVHLDHCIKLEDVELALGLPFDSIMVDASKQDQEANIRFCKDIIERAKSRNITIEAELGRIEGGEDGLPHIDMDTVLTRPDEAGEFVRRTGVHYLAPSFGNIHGGYPPGGAKKSWDLSRLSSIAKMSTTNIPLVLHGTHAVSDELFLKAVRCGVRKVNLNRTVRDEYTRFVAEKSGSLELTTLKTEAVEVYTRSIERMMDVLGSSSRY
ncbi:fructose-bisphosphate aldolase [Talaromyces proteolyticus]|uniref:Fructose-bisphosphate aldolase n=1 Tax=Talaromyces proteolyticus TaxID=1131652 RepID=A0AAD4KIZ0_9EURO|nr:fructose-bisphosphate aldolase [Talaromyces proteolyticus]KAH8689585.1 fructose-bisphosphate aldolase [Talaromyces proteolyticus]